MEHVPSLRDHLLALGASIDVKTCSEDHVRHVVRDPSDILVLLDRTGKGDEEEQHPRDTDLGEHLEVDRSNSRVERDTHKVIVDPDTAKTEGLSAPPEQSSSNLDKEGAGERGDQGDGHELSKVLDDPGETVDAGLVEHKAEHERDVPRGEGVALVRQGLVVERRDRETSLVDTGEDGGEEELDDGETEVGFDGKLGRIGPLRVSGCVRVPMIYHSSHRRCADPCGRGRA